jgi:hypothetical protein
MLAGQPPDYGHRRFTFSPDWCMPFRQSSSRRFRCPTVRIGAKIGLDDLAAVAVEAEVHLLVVVSAELAERVRTIGKVGVPIATEKKTTNFGSKP